MARHTNQRLNHRDIEQPDADYAGCVRARKVPGHPARGALQPEQQFTRATPHSAARGGQLEPNVTQDGQWERGNPRALSVVVDTRSRRSGRMLSGSRIAEEAKAQGNA
jgi:hypothetical protein